MWKMYLKSNYVIKVIWITKTILLFTVMYAYNSVNIHVYHKTTSAEISGLTR